eukprot:TRINITY_DN4225_c2_g1_i7.p1 TRINITY_DN4225_c2_g1~~TRINITY_DN4225_c2_g1_i7.p1  ORF type:complete len:751 (+),score=205.24 TRINITY_DN4225_c2_g1_i7:258-2510(+)
MMSSSSSSSSSIEWTFGSDDLWLNILSHLDASGLCAVAQTCTFLHDLSLDRFLWAGVLERSRKRVVLVPREVPYTPRDLYRHKKDYDTITEALQAAGALDERHTIYVSPGLYREHLVLDKPIDIIGEGPLGGTIVEGVDGNTLACKADETRVANLVLTQSGFWFCIDIERGSVRIEGCHITNKTLSAIKVAREASPVICDNIIFDTNEAGIAIFGGSGVIERNEFRGNRYGSIEVVYSSSSPIIRQNNIHHNIGYGIHIHSEAKCLIEENEIHHNDSDGVACWGGCTPLIRKNRVHNNKGDGLYLYDNCLGNFVENEVYEQRLDGVRISGASPSLEGNHFHHNEGDGVRLVVGANPILKNNKISENRRVGVHVYREGRGLLEGNLIMGNKNAGVQVYGAGQSVLVENRILGNHCSGIYMSDGAVLEVRGNEVAYNGDAGVEIVSGGSAKIFQLNMIHHNQMVGVAFYPDSKPILLETANKIYKNGDNDGIDEDDDDDEEEEEYNHHHHHSHHPDEASREMADCATHSVSEASYCLSNASSFSSLHEMCTFEEDDDDEEYDHHHDMEMSSQHSSCCGDIDGDVDMMVSSPVLSSMPKFKAGPQRFNHADLVEREAREMYLQPIKKGMETEIVSFLAEKAIQARQCTFSFTKEYYHAQYWYECRTCSQTRSILGKSELSICETCARTCHKGHELGVRKFGHFYCDCGQITNGQSSCCSMPPAATYIRKTLRKSDSGVKVNFNAINRTMAVSI